MVEIYFKRINSVAVLDLCGNVDIDAANFIEKIGWCLENGYAEILCDFADVQVVDYAGLSVLAIAFKNVANHKARIKLLNVAMHIRKVFSLMYLDRVVEIYEDEELALNSFREDKIIAEIQKKQLRRRFKRLPLDIKIGFRSQDKEEQMHSGKVLNLSAVGLLMVCHKTYPLGEILDIKLSLLPKPGELELKAKAVWLVQKELQPELYPGLGLAFHNLDSLTQKGIVEFIERNLSLDSVG